MQLIFIWGGAASGKLTVATELARLTALPLFHNHLVVDALLERLEFGEPEFIRLREHMWMAAFEMAAKQSRSLIFTFAPEPTVPDGFTDRVEDLIARSGGKVRYVRLVVAEDEQEARIANESRSAFRKLTSLEQLRELRPRFRESEAAMPPADLVIDTGQDDPETSARRIASAFGLAAASGAT